MSVRNIIQAAAGAGGGDNLYVEDVFSTYLYVGTGASNTITNGIDLSGSGGLVWIKCRNDVYEHKLTDTARGAQVALVSNVTAGQASEPNGLTAFTASGFTLGSDPAHNASSQSLTSWTFRKAAKFFDVVTYTGNGASSRSISHALASTPGCVIVKRRDTTGRWKVWHRSVPSQNGNLNDTSAFDANDNNMFFQGYISATSSTTFTVSQASTGLDDVNANGATYVAYLFAHDAGGFGNSGSESVIKCGSYTGTGADLSVSLGWEPQWLLIKRTNLAADWNIVDTARGSEISGVSQRLVPNTAGAEVASGAGLIFPTSTGFGSSAASSVINNTGDTYIYIAIRRGLMKTPTDATKVFVPTVYTGNNSDNRLLNTTISPDFVMIRQRNDTVVPGMYTGSRLTGNGFMLTGSTAIEGTDADSFDAQLQATEIGNAWSSSTGIFVGNDATRKFNVNTTSNNHVIHAFKRATGFMDVVCYKGTGAAQNIPHNLGVEPELMISKQRSGAQTWLVYAKPLGNGQYLRLDAADVATATSLIWNTTTPTASVFTVGPNASLNAQNYLALLFASVPGVSKIGTYTGNGGSQTIDCGFTAGARYVLIKRTDNGANWNVFDTARGIIAGSDPYIGLNTTAAEDTARDALDPSNTGFIVNQTTSANINQNVGVDWNAKTSGITGGINGVAYGNGLFVAGANGGDIISSPSGESWTTRTSQFSGSNIDGVAYGGGLFVAVGQSGKISTSPDGITWTARTSGVGNYLHAVTYGGGLFVAVGNGGTLLTSPDGITWTSRTSGFGTTNILSAGFGNGVYVVGGASGTLATSTDGVTWTLRTSGVSQDINGIVYGNGVYVFVGGGVIRSSTDAITWTSRVSGSANTYRGVAFGNGVYVAIGEDVNGAIINTSTDVVNWTSRSTGLGGSSGLSVGYGNNTFVGGGGSGSLSTSSSNYLYLAIA